MTKKKILHIMSSYGGGISSFVRNLAKEIDTAKYEFDVISFSDYSNDFIDDITNTNGVCMKMPRPKEKGYLYFFRETIKLIDKNGPYEIVESHLTGFYALAFKLICIITGNKRFVVHAHATDDDLKDNLLSEIFRKLSRFITVSVATQLTSCSVMASDFMFGKKAVRKQDIVHIPNSISLSKYVHDFTEEQINQIKKENGIPRNKLTIGNIARFNLQKNHQFMIRIIEYLAKEGIDFVWIFIGSGELENKIMNQLDELDLISYVHFLGRREDVNILYSIMDVFVLPSFYEGLPTVAVEAQAAGVNSVISDSITREVDLELDMINYVSLESDLSIWKDQIIQAYDKKVCPSEIRKQIISEKGFSNRMAAKLYENFIENKVSTFMIGDKIKL